MDCRAFVLQTSKVGVCECLHWSETLEVFILHRFRIISIILLLPNWVDPKPSLVHTGEESSNVGKFSFSSYMLSGVHIQDEISSRIRWVQCVSAKFRHLRVRGDNYSSIGIQVFKSTGNWSCCTETLRSRGVRILRV